MHLSSTGTLDKATRVLSTTPGQKYMTSIDMDYFGTTELIVFWAYVYDVAETNPIPENSLGFGFVQNH